MDEDFAVLESDRGDLGMDFLEVILRSAMQIIWNKMIKKIKGRIKVSLQCKRQRRHMSSLPGPYTDDEKTIEIEDRDVADFYFASKK